MCIRDRARVKERDAAIKLVESKLASTGEFQKFYGAVMAGCLLYTSDAADDLLCVDIGGRRIIKKKKQQKKTQKKKKIKPTTSQSNTYNIH